MCTHVLDVPGPDPGELLHQAAPVPAISAVAGAKGAGGEIRHHSGGIGGIFQGGEVFAAIDECSRGRDCRSRTPFGA